MYRRTLTVHRNVPAAVVEPLEATFTPQFDAGLELHHLQSAQSTHALIVVAGQRSSSGFGTGVQQAFIR